MSKATTTLPCVCAVCGREIEGLPYHAAGIVKKGEYYLSIVTCSREHQRAYNARHKDRKSTRLNSSHRLTSRMPSSA
jgi:hypothetical protein